MPKRYLVGFLAFMAGGSAFAQSTVTPAELDAYNAAAGQTHVLQENGIRPRDTSTLSCSNSTGSFLNPCNGFSEVWVE